MKELFIFLIITFFGLSFDRLNVFKYCIISSILHECGHIAAYMLFMKKFPEIKISVFGFSMKNDIIQHKFYSVVLIAGPFVNMMLFIVSLILLQPRFSLDIYVFMIVNMVIFVINVIPVYYLDGGQFLYLNSMLFQRFYKQIGILCILILSVMVLYFTDNIVPIFAFIVYFFINVANDI